MRNLMAKPVLSSALAASAAHNLTVAETDQPGRRLQAIAIKRVRRSLSRKYLFHRPKDARRAAGAREPWEGDLRSPGGWAARN